MNLEDGIKYTSLLIERAKNKILIYDGHFDPRLYQNEQVVRTIKYAISRGVKVQVVCDENAEICNDELDSMIKNKAIDVFRKNLDYGLLSRVFSSHHRDKGHFMVVDSMHTREEEPHKIESRNRKANIIYFSEDAVNLVNKFYRLRDF
nr:hypothetical protein [Candidatus Woesearchaeota archaeon]